MNAGHDGDSADGELDPQLVAALAAAVCAELHEEDTAAVSQAALEELKGSQKEGVEEGAREEARDAVYLLSESNGTDGEGYSLV